MMRHSFLLFLCLFASTLLTAQVTAPPIPQRITIHSKILNEDRVLWVRMPAAAQGKTEKYPVAYLMDAGSNVNEFGDTMDFLADNNFMPPMIVVAILNTDRVRDMTPTPGVVKHSDGSVNRFPTSGGADKFLDCIETELAPEIDKRYATEPYRIVVGHSLSGLFAIHALMNRPQLFHAAIATSPSLWWNDFDTLHKAEVFFPKQKEFKRALFFALGNEHGDMIPGFEGLRKLFAAKRPEGFIVGSEHFLNELHTSTELLGHYNGLRTIFANWRVPLDEKTDLPVGGLEGLDKHYDALDERFGFKVSREKAINSLGYSLLGNKKVDEAIAAFKRNVELYPRSANVYDSLADGLEAAGKKDEALQNVQKAVQVGAETGDPQLDAYKKHLQQLTAKPNSAKAP